MHEKNTILLAKEEGYKGENVCEAKEWLQAKITGLDLSFGARMERAREMGFDIDTVWYRGEYGKHASYSAIHSRQIPTFTTNKKIAEIYAENPNTPSDTPYKRILHEVFLRVGYRANLTYTEDPYVEFDVIANLVGVEAAKEIFIQESPAITNTDNWHEISKELGITNLVELPTAYWHQIYATFFQIADNRHLHELLKSKGYHSIYGYGASVGEIVEEIRIFNLDDIRSIHAAFDPSYINSNNLTSQVDTTTQAANSDEEPLWLRP